MFRGVLAFRTSGVIAPGSVDFLLVALVWAAAGFGLDACLRRVPNGLFKLLNPVGLGICLLVLLIRSG